MKKRENYNKKIILGFNIMIENKLLNIKVGYI